MSWLQGSDQKFPEQSQLSIIQYSYINIFLSPIASPFHCSWPHAQKAAIHAQETSICQRLVCELLDFFLGLTPQHPRANTCPNRSRVWALGHVVAIVIVIAIAWYFTSRLVNSDFAYSTYLCNLQLSLSRLMENKLTLNKAQNATRLQFATERSGSQISDLLSATAQMALK